MLITPSFKKRLIVKQFQGNYLRFFLIEHSILRPSVTIAWTKIGLKAKLKEVVVKTARAIGDMWARLWSSSGRWHFWPPEAPQKFNYEFTSPTWFAAHASSPLFSGRNVDQTRESGGIEPTIYLAIVKYFCPRMITFGVGCYFKAPTFLILLSNRLLLNNWATTRAVIGR